MSVKQSVTLESLQNLSDSGKREALQAAMAWCSTKELRGFCGGMGVRVRSKEYAAFHTKAGYTELLVQLLRAESANKGLAVGPVPTPIVLAPVERSRRTKNCNLRLLNVLFSDSMGPFLSAMNAEPAPEEMVGEAVGGGDPFWSRFRAEYMSDKPEYASVAFQEPNLAGFDLSTPVPHSCTKLSDMWLELSEAYRSAFIRFTHATDPDVEFAGCCPSRSDVFYMHCWLNVKPGLLSNTCAKLPASIGLSSASHGPVASGIEGAAAAAGAETFPHATPSRKRSRSAMTRGLQSSVARDAPSQDAERALLMQAIGYAVDILKTTRGLDLGPEVEETVWCELQRCTRRLRRMQQEEDDEETEEEDDEETEEEEQSH